MQISESIFLKDYIQIRNGSTLSFGGSQTWFPVTGTSHERLLHRAGCGLVAEADLLLCLGRKFRTFARVMPEAFRKDPDRPIDRTAYLKMLERLSHLLFPIFPKAGSFNFEPLITTNHFLRTQGRPERLHYRLWNGRRNRDSLIRSQLEKGFPVPLIIGQHFLKPRSKKGISFYSFREGKPLLEAANVYRHYVTITGIYLPENPGLPMYYEVSSWGSRYYIDCEELDHYISHESAPWLTSIYLLK